MKCSSCFAQVCANDSALSAGFALRRDNEQRSEPKTLIAPLDDLSSNV